MKDAVEFLGLYIAILLVAVIFMLLYSGVTLLGFPGWLGFLIATLFVTFIFNLIDK
ncbi:hypothetical protein [Peribacillus muralis]|uniref:hypothetical protein n=1 Tax=Peribacillus muralis TaxID=264697 RepID=UPI00366FBDEE